MNKPITKSDFMVVEVRNGIVFVIDLDLGNMSVTNDAENVWDYVQTNHPNNRLVYRDSMYQWDEIVVNQRGRVDFIPYGGYIPKRV